MSCKKAEEIPSFLYFPFPTGGHRKRKSRKKENHEKGKDARVKKIELFKYRIMIFK